MYHVSLQKYGSIRYCITIFTVRILCHYLLKNRAIIEYVTDKLISKLLYYKYRLLIPLQHIRMSHKTSITQHYIATSIFMEHSITIQYSITVSIYCYIDMYCISLMSTFMRLCVCVGRMSEHNFPKQLLFGQLP